MYDFEIMETVAEVGEHGKALQIVKWGDRAPKLDLRKWQKDGENMKPCKGLTLTEEEARDLLEGLQEYLAS